MDEVIAHHSGDLADGSADGFVVEDKLSGFGILSDLKSISSRPERHHWILRIVGPLLAIGREGCPDAKAVPILGLKVEQLVAPLWVGLRFVLDDAVRPERPLEKDVVLLGSLELHQSQTSLYVVCIKPLLPTRAAIKAKIARLLIIYRFL